MVYGRLMNESIARSRTRGSPIWREKTMMITHFGKPNISLHESISMMSSTSDWSFQSNVEKPQGFEAYQKETLVCRWKKTTWWRTSNA
jgi:hypothetical protein